MQQLEEGLALDLQQMKVRLQGTPGMLEASGVPFPSTLHE